MRPVLFVFLYLFEFVGFFFLMGLMALMLSVTLASAVYCVGAQEWWEFSWRCALAYPVWLSVWIMFDRTSDSVRRDIDRLSPPTSDV